MKREKKERVKKKTSPDVPQGLARRQSGVSLALVVPQAAFLNTNLHKYESHQPKPTPFSTTVVVAVVQAVRVFVLENLAA
ncbi:hypothetical protein EUTSA_v10015168mg [Eutrema salsugineum]|uniref:Uncharacterized protein n=1 Tax=Eutrema salsugineum TaxID=72664 RepID=V4KSZ4_EUTSA|nr:hypothetical protein EUTSA_v10015168mg [Eutrema salsugineum]